jgi:hypothetical protein
MATVAPIHGTDPAIPLAPGLDQTPFGTARPAGPPANLATVQAWGRNVEVPLACPPAGRECPVSVAAAIRFGRAVRALAPSTLRIASGRTRVVALGLPTAVRAMLARERSATLELWLATASTPLHMVKLEVLATPADVPGDELRPAIRLAFPASADSDRHARLRLSGADWRAVRQRPGRASTVTLPAFRGAKRLQVRFPTSDGAEVRRQVMLRSAP